LVIAYRAAESADTPSAPGKDKTLLTFGLKHMVGSLASALTIFSKHGINMRCAGLPPLPLPSSSSWQGERLTLLAVVVSTISGIESYPNKAEQWSYNFLVELEGHVEDKNVKAALDDLRDAATFINIIGSFPEAYP
jgi:chorismate mutase/prephenate dehydratase